MCASARAGIVCRHYYPGSYHAGVYGFNSQQSTDIIQVALFFRQSTRPFRPSLPSVALAAVCPSSWAFRSRSCRPCRPWVPRALALVRCWAARSSAAPSRSSFGLAYSKIKWLFPPVVTGTVIFSIGVSLYPTAVKYMAGGMGTPLWGTPQAWCVALITFAVVFALANFGKGTLKLGIRVLWHDRWHDRFIPFGMIDFSSVATAQVFTLPKLMPYALEFNSEVCITLAVVFPIIAIQVIGDVSAACLGSIDRMPTECELSGAIMSRASPLWSAASWAVFPPAPLARTWASSAPTRSLTSGFVSSIAAVFAIAGLFPQLSAVLSAIPQPVIGGATVASLAPSP